MVLLQPHVNGQAGEAFESDVEVKQGDPASPELFGLFIETFSDFVDAMDKGTIAATCPRTGVLLHPCCDDTPKLEGADGPVSAISLLFADDINLLALSADRMNYLLALLSIYCDAFGMSVNTRKCELLVFHPVRARREVFESKVVLYRGERLVPKDRARYLGLYYSPPQIQKQVASLSFC